MAPDHKPDAVLVAAVDLARGAAESIAEPGKVGEHEGVVRDGERLATHYFTCLAGGYRGWRWAVTLARAPRHRHATICETNLLPGESAVLAPPWVPYAQRLAPGDLGPGDVLPYQEDDPNLEPGFEPTGEEDVDELALQELGLGRPRVLSALGREAAAQRWYAGRNGPESPGAAQAKATCATCGYLLPLAGALRRSFGVCACEWSSSDGSVVSLDHGCGAHSEVEAPPPASYSVPPPIVDDFSIQSLD